MRLRGSQSRRSVLQLAGHVIRAKSNSGGRPLGSEQGGPQQDRVVTPRIGKPVEVNALWYTALKTMVKLAPFAGKSAESFPKVAERVIPAWMHRSGFDRGRGA